MSSFTPTPWLRDGLTIYALNEGGTNRMSISIHGGWQHGCYHATNDTRTSSEELSNNAAFIVKAVNSHTALVTALTDLLKLHEAHHNHPVHAAARAALSTEGEKDAPRDDGWIEWKGGKRPVPDETYVRVKGVSGLSYKPAPAGSFSWEYVKAYRVVRP